MYAKTKCTKQYVRSAISKQKIMYKILLYMSSTDVKEFFVWLLLIRTLNGSIGSL